MSNFQFSGSIHSIGETQQITDTFSKREFVITDNAEQYAKFINFELVKDKCDLMDNFTIGQMITVDFNLEGRLWVNPQDVEKCFNSLKAWKVVLTEGVAQQDAPAQITPEEADDLPF
tara:strand:- start:365 stop:715 length:351 start_codon:yes stop_codon:yes gene_type:complete